MYKKAYNGVINLTKNQYIQEDATDVEWLEYLEWKDEGNKPSEATPFIYKIVDGSLINLYDNSIIPESNTNKDRIAFNRWIADGHKVERECLIEIVQRLYKKISRLHASLVSTLLKEIIKNKELLERINNGEEVTDIVNGKIIVLSITDIKARINKSKKKLTLFDEVRNSLIKEITHSSDPDSIDIETPFKQVV